MATKATKATKLLKVTLLFMLFALVCSPIAAEAKEGKGKAQQNECISKSAVKLKEDMRKLWIEHDSWNREYVISALAGLEDRSKVLARLLKNQEDIGNAIKPYYGEAAGTKLTELLKEHILIAGKILEAKKSGNQANLKKFNEDWYKNADDIAQFLSSANPNWPINELKDLLHMHLQMITDEVEARLKKDWDADILASDKGGDHIIKMADTLTEGIIKQFPNQF